MASISSGSLRQRGKTRWQARYCRTDRKGTKIITRTFEASSRRAAEIRKQEIRQDLLAEEESDMASSDLVEYMEEYVRDREETGQIEPSTATNYRSSIKHISRYLGGLTLEEVTAESILEMQSQLLQDGLVSDTVAKDHRFLKQVMDYAAEVGHIPRSPFVKALKPPKRKKPTPNALDEKSRAALLDVLDASPTTKQSVAARLGLLAGLRREEVAGLRWDDVDLQRRVLTIRRAIGVADGKPYVKGPKTEAGEREVVIEDSLAHALAALKEERHGGGNSYVLGGETEYYSPDRITKDFTSLAKTMNLTGAAGKRATFHDLRDTFATHLVTSGVNIKTVSYLLGHSNSAFTINVYTSNTPAGMESAAEALSGLAV